MLGPPRSPKLFSDSHLAPRPRPPARARPAPCARGGFVYGAGGGHNKRTPQAGDNGRIPPPLGPHRTPFPPPPAPPPPPPRGEGGPAPGGRAAPAARRARHGGVE